MPKPTWENLDPSKRQRVLRAALQEFATRGYTAGSLNTVAREARVSKGSLFQYFEDKFDLWVTVVEYASTQVRDALMPGVRARSGGTFDEQVLGLIADWTDHFFQRPIEQGGAVTVSTEPDQLARSIALQTSERSLCQLVDPMFASAKGKHALICGSDPSLVYSQLIVLLRHLATAPFLPGEDKSLDLTFHSESAVRAKTRELGEAFLRAWTRPTGDAPEHLAKRTETQETLR